MRRRPSPPASPVGSSPPSATASRGRQTTTTIPERRIRTGWTRRARPSSSPLYSDGLRKGRWAAAKRKEGHWADVRALDADDLVHWLETAPAVAQWLAQQIGRRPEGLTDLAEAWREWSLATDPALTEDSS